MSLIQTPWTSQPQQAVGIDQSTGVLSATTFADPDRWSLLGGATRSALRGGIAVVGDNSAKYATRAASISSAPPLFLVAQFTRTGTPDDGDVVYSLSTGASIGAFIAIRATATSGLTVFYRCDDGGGLFEVGTTSAVAPLNGLTTVVAVVPSLSSSDAYIYVNGTKYSSQISSGTLSAVYRTYVNESICALKRDSVSLYSPYAVYGCSYGRYITEARARELSQNPWQIFKPIPRRIFVPVSAATGDATGTGSFYDVTLSFPTGTASGTGAVNGTGTGSLSAVSTTAPSATATGSALATGALTTVTLTTITASATGSALATGSLDAIDLSTVSGSATGTTAGNAEGVGSVATIALSAPSASAVGSALATGSFSHISLSAVSGTASAATNGQATADLQPISISAPLAIAIASSVATGGVQSIGLTAPTGSASGQAQTIARPGSDTSNSGWTPSTGSDLYAMLDEVTPNDADYISTNSAGSVCRLGLGAVADPGTASGQVVSYRASSSTGNGLRVELMQGGTVIATWNHATLPATDTTYQQSLSAAECDAITDYTALSVRLTSL